MGSFLREHAERLDRADFPRSVKVAAWVDLCRKVGPMLFRGTVLRPMLKGAGGPPLVGRGVRVRGARQLTIGRHVIFEDFAEIQATSSDGVTFGDRVSIGSMTMIRPSGYYSRELGVGLRVGDRTGIGPSGYIGCSGGIDIGSDVMFGPGVMLFAEDHAFADVEQTIKSQDVRRASIVIEDDCWLASRVIVTRGVRIGQGSVVGAGSVVTRDIPAWSVVAGNPARVLRSRKASE